MIDMRITSGRTAFLDLKIAQGKLDQAIRQSIRDLAREYRNKLLGELRSSKRGRRYAKRSGRAVYRRVRATVTIGNQKRTGRVIRAARANVGTYTASAPGEAPAVATGTMQRAIRTKIGGRNGAFSARVFADRGTAFYRHFLEFGTGPRVTRRAKLVNGKSRKQRAVARASAGSLAPRPVFSPLQSRLTRDLEARVAQAVAGFGR